MCECVIYKSITEEDKDRVRGSERERAVKNMGDGKGEVEVSIFLNFAKGRGGGFLVRDLVVEASRKPKWKKEVLHNCSAWKQHRECMSVRVYEQ